jgi:hypothetical protein
MNDGRMQDTMAATLDPQSQVPAQSLTPPPAVSSAARAVLRGGANVRACLEELLNRGLPSDALVLVARALPKRYVVAWACDCLKTAFAKDPQTTDVDRAGLALAQAWLSDPTDDNRRAAMDYAAVSCPRATMWLRRRTIFPPKPRSPPCASRQAAAPITRASATDS